MCNTLAYSTLEANSSAQFPDIIEQLPPPNIQTKSTLLDVKTNAPCPPCGHPNKRNEGNPMRQSNQHTVMSR